jgi:hypothetical protein
MKAWYMFNGFIVGQQAVNYSNPDFPTCLDT